MLRAMVPASKSLWILEDDPEACFVYQQMFVKHPGTRYFENLATLDEAFRQCAESERGWPQLLIADLWLPDGSFLDYLGSDHAFRLLKMPFLVVSGCDDEAVLRACFEEGAIDFLIKPFKKAELRVKVDRLLAPASRKGRSADYEFDPERLTVTHGGQSVELTARELQIFSILHRSNPKPVKRKELEDGVWKGAAVSNKVLDVHLFHLRRKLEPLRLRIEFSAPDGYRLNGADLSLRLMLP